MSSFHERARMKMAADRITQLELSQKTGLATTTIGRFVREVNDISLGNAQIISDVLGVPIDDPVGSGLHNAGQSVVADTEEAWSTFYNGSDPLVRPYLFRHQFVAGFIAGRRSA